MVYRLVAAAILLQRWPYIPLRSTNLDIMYVPEPKTRIMDDQFASQLALLWRVAKRMSMRDLVVEFTMLRIWPLQMG